MLGPAPRAIAYSPTLHSTATLNAIGVTRYDRHRPKPENQRTEIT